MTNYEIKTIAKDMNKLSLVICNHYKNCQECPLHIDWSKIKLNAVTVTGENCLSIIMQRVIATNLPKED